MSTAINAAAVRTPTFRTEATLLDLGRAFEDWSDPSAYEPTYEELSGGITESEDLDAALEIRSFCL